MLRTVEAVIDANGEVRLLEPIQVSASCRSLVTILDDEVQLHPNALAILSESALAKDWNRPEEDEAWSYLDPG
jgi:hypothetical protein